MVVFESRLSGLGFGGGFGNGYASSVGLTYGKGGLGFNAGLSSTYMWGEITPGATSESIVDGVLQDGDISKVRGNTGLYEDETLAYNVMVEQTKSTGVETAAWLTDNGVLVSPIEYNGLRNTATVSHNTYYRVTVAGKNYYAHHLGKRFKMIGQIHTHPSSNRGLSIDDKNFARRLPGMSVYTIGPRDIHVGSFNQKDYQMNFFAHTKYLLNGRIKIINR